MNPCWKCEFLDSAESCELCHALAVQMWLLELAVEHQTKPNDFYPRPPGVPDAPPAP